MANSSEPWTNEAILSALLKSVVSDIYERATENHEVIEAVTDGNFSRLSDQLVELQMGVLDSLFSLIDGSRRLDDWPGVKLVNGETCEPLAPDLGWELSRVESEYLEEN